MKQIILLFIIFFVLSAARPESADMRGWYFVIPRSFADSMAGNYGSNGELFNCDTILNGCLCPMRYEGIFTGFSGRHFPSYELYTEQVRELLIGIPIDSVILH